MSSDEVEVVVEEGAQPVEPEAAAPWNRLSVRMIPVDLARTAVSLLPAVVAFVVLDVPVNAGTTVPLAFIAVLGAGGAVADVVRWVTTRYRVTERHVERRTGLLVRRYRSIRRDRIRSVDVDARLRHRVAGLRVVTVGAGQQTGAAESALALDALARTDALALQSALLGSGHEATDHATGRLATARPWWAVYQAVSLWSLMMGAGLLWGGGFALSTFGVDVLDDAARLVDWDDRGALASIMLVLSAVLAVGAVGMAISYVLTYWAFTLSRVTTDHGTSIRTRHGLLRTREVNRDEARMRGVIVSEPLPWRWMRATDLEILTTGLNLWSANEPSRLLPRAPRSVATGVAARVLDADHDPLAAPLLRHPRSALRRRIVWATVVSTALLAVVAWLTVIDVVPGWTVGAAAGAWPAAVLAAFVAYYALGHAVTERHLVVRSGLTSRRTAVLQRDAVSTVVVRQSVLQRRLGLRTMTGATAAGWGGYPAVDVAADDAWELAHSVLPGLLEEFREPAGHR